MEKRGPSPYQDKLLTASSERRHRAFLSHAVGFEGDKSIPRIEPPLSAGVAAGMESPETQRNRTHRFTESFPDND